MVSELDTNGAESRVVNKESMMRQWMGSLSGIKYLFKSGYLKKGYES